MKLLSAQRYCKNWNLFVIIILNYLYIIQMARNWLWSSSIDSVLMLSLDVYAPSPIIITLYLCLYKTIISVYIWTIMTRKSSKHPHTTYGTAVSTLLGLISSAYCDLHCWRSNQQPQNAEAETLPRGHRSLSCIIDAELTSHGDNARPLSLMCLEGMYFLQRPRSPPGLRLPKSVLWIPIIYIYIYIYIERERERERKRERER